MPRVPTAPTTPTAHPDAVPVPRWGYNLNEWSQGWRDNVFRDAFKQSWHWQLWNSTSGYSSPWGYWDGAAWVDTSVPVWASGVGAGYPDWTQDEFAVDGDYCRSIVVSGHLDAGVSVLPRGTDPTGGSTWKLTWSGDGTISMFGQGLTVGTTGTGFKYYTAPTGCGSFAVEIRASNAQGVGNGPIRDICVWGPDLETDETGLTTYESGVPDSGVIRHDWMDKIIEGTPTGSKPVLRLMGWAAANHVGNSDRSPYDQTSGKGVSANAWDCSDVANRITDTSPRQLFGTDGRRRGVSIEHCVDLVNELGVRSTEGADGWYCLPHRGARGYQWNGTAVTDAQYLAYNQAIATVVAANLTAGNNWFLEFSNETWNTDFGCHNFIEGAYAPGTWTHGPDGDGDWSSLYKKEFREAVAVEIQSVFEPWLDKMSAVRDQLFPVVMGWNRDLSFLSKVLEHLDDDAVGGDDYVGREIAAAGCNFYTTPSSAVSNTWVNTTPAIDVYNELFRIWRTAVPNIFGLLKEHRGFITTYPHMLFLGYEGGQGLYARLGDLGWSAAAANFIYSTYAYDLYRHMITDLSDPLIRMDIPMWFHFCGKPGKAGTKKQFFGHLKHLYVTANTTTPGEGDEPRWDALVEGPS